MKNWLINKWDWFIYQRAEASFRRISERKPGIAIVYQMQLEDWIAKNPVPENLRKSAETFYREMEEHSDGQ